MTVDDVVGAAFLPTDGQANPTDITMALARGARQAGATICEDTEVLEHRGGRRRDQGGRHVAADASSAASSCAAPGSGRARSPPRSASTCRWSRCSTSTSSPTPFSPAVPRNLPDAARPGSPDLLQGGGRRSGDGRLRAEPDPVGDAAGSPPISTSSCSIADFDHFAPTMELAIGRVPALADRRHQRVDQRPRELHARRQLHPRRGTGVEELLRRRRVQRLRHRRRRWRRAWRWPSGCIDGVAAVRPVGRRHPPVRSPAPGHRLGAHPHARGVRQALHHGVAARRARQRPAVPHVAAVLDDCSPTGACFGEKLGWERPNWFAVGRPWRDAARRVQLRTAELVRGRRTRASRRPRGRGADRPDVVRQVRAEGARRLGRT